MKRDEVIDVGSVTEELEPIQTDGAVLSAFLGGLVPFFGRARELETTADELSQRAAKLKAPVNGAEDATVQQFVQRANGAKKAIEEHWGVTSAFHRLHRKLTALRDRGATKASEAAERAQRLHNQYVAAERARVAEENARRQREAEEEAERKRNAEIVRAEAEAVQREEAMGELSDRERRFVELFAFGLHTGETAARSAGFKDARLAAKRLLGLAKIMTAIKAAQEAAALRRQAEATRQRPLEVVERQGTDRTTWRGVVLDERLFIEAVLGGKHGIPADVLTVNQSKITEYARSMHELMNRWPGVKAEKTTKTI